MTNAASAQQQAAALDSDCSHSSQGARNLHGSDSTLPVGVLRQDHIALRRLKYALRFTYWTLRHRSTANARWICAYEGYEWP
jgi:hypothetical protein